MFLKMCGKEYFKSLNCCIMPIIHIFWSAEKRHGWWGTITCGTVERFCQCWDGRKTKVSQNIKREWLFCHPSGDSPAKQCSNFCKNNCDINEMNKQMKIFKSENPEMENHFDEVFIHGDIWTNFLTILSYFGCYAEIFSKRMNFSRYIFVYHTGKVL